MHTKQFLRLFFLLLRVLTFASLSFAQSPSELTEASNAVKTSLLYDRTAIQPPPNSETPSGRIGIQFTIAPGWHIYWRNSGQTGLPTRIDWELPQDWKTSELIWPVPYKIHEQGGINTYGYTNEVLLFASLFPPLVIPEAKQSAKIAANVSWLACKDICVPGQSSLEITLPFSTSEALETSREYPLFEAAEDQSPKSQDSFIRGSMPIKVLSSALNITRGKTLNGAILLQGLPISKTENIAKYVQIFPYRSDAAEVGIGKSTRNINPDNKSDILISFPVTVSPDAEPGKIDIEGVLVLSSKLFANKNQLPIRDTVLAWKLPLTVVSPQVALAPNPAFDAALKNTTAANFAELTYRVLEQKDEPPSPAPDAVTQPRPDTPTSGTGFAGLAIALLSAFFGGILLNLMPCVLPIIAIKVLSFVKQAEHSPKMRFTFTLSFVLGILSSFLFLALLVVSFRSVGHQLGWGFQLQSPSFVFLLALVVFVLSLSLFDVYTVSLPFMQQANTFGSSIHAPLLKHFFEGILTTLLSTPCTAPILYTALAFAFSAPPVFTVCIFLAIGLGLAFPYVLLASNTKLLSLLPRPGNWMLAFRQLMGFFLLATVVWLLFILQRQTGEGVSWALGVMLVAYFCLWLRHALSKIEDLWSKRMLVNATLGVFFIAVLYVAWPRILGGTSTNEVSSAKLISWQPYSAELIEELKAKDVPVFIDFTADWCVTCKVNEFFVVETPKVAQAISDNGITAVKGDWTKGDEAITKALRSYGAQGVPLYVVIPKGGGEPMILSSLLTSRALLEAFRTTAGN